MTIYIYIHTYLYIYICHTKIHMLPPHLDTFPMQTSAVSRVAAGGVTLHPLLTHFLQEPEPQGSQFRDFPQGFKIWWGFSGGSNRSGHFHFLAFSRCTISCNPYPFKRHEMSTPHLKSGLWGKTATRNYNLKFRNTAYMSGNRAPQIPPLYPPISWFRDKSIFHIGSLDGSSGTQQNHTSHSIPTSIKSY